MLYPKCKFFTVTGLTLASLIPLAATAAIPVANAGADQQVPAGDSVTIYSRGSFDADNDPLSFSWAFESKPQGSSASLRTGSVRRQNFIADIGGEYVVRLVVNDGQSDSIADYVTITALGGGSSDTDITDAFFSNQSGDCQQYAGNYYANVTDIQRGIDFNGDVVISTGSGKCTFDVNEIPNHNFNDNSANFATNTSEQISSYQVADSPQFNAQVTTLNLDTSNAIMLNGVLVDLLAAACYDVGNEPVGQEKIGCGPDQIDNPWRYDPMSPMNDFGTDQHNAHTQPDGTYHYHGDPLAMYNTDCDITAEVSPVIGFAADGFPIYGNCFDDNGTIRKAQSSYVLKNNGGTRQAVSGYTTPVAGVGTIVSANYDGQFRGDYQYSQGAGDLDECNGMTVNGQYGYYITDSYPWVLGCYKGTPDESLQKAGPALDNLMHTH